MRRATSQGWARCRRCQPDDFAANRHRRDLAHGGSGVEDREAAVGGVLGVSAIGGRVVQQLRIPEGKSKAG